MIKYITHNFTQKSKIILAFIHPHAVPDLYDFSYSDEHKWRIFFVVVEKLTIFVSSYKANLWDLQSEAY